MVNPPNIKAVQIGVESTQGSGGWYKPESQRDTRAARRANYNRKTCPICGVEFRYAARRKQIPVTCGSDKCFSEHNARAAIQSRDARLAKLGGKCSKGLHDRTPESTGYGGRCKPCKKVYAEEHTAKLSKAKRPRSLPMTYLREQGAFEKVSRGR